MYSAAEQLFEKASADKTKAQLHLELRFCFMFSRQTDNLPSLSIVYQSNSLRFIGKTRPFLNFNLITRAFD